MKASLVKQNAKVCPRLCGALRKFASVRRLHSTFSVMSLENVRNQEDSRRIQSSAMKNDERKRTSERERWFLVVSATNITEGHNGGIPLCIVEPAYSLDSNPIQSTGNEHGLIGLMRLNRVYK